MAIFSRKLRLSSTLLKRLQQKVTAVNSKNVCRSFTTTEGHRPTLVHKRSIDILHDPWFNKGTAFSLTERDRLNLRGLLPPIVMSSNQQIEHFSDEVREESSAPAPVPIRKWRMKRKRFMKRKDLKSGSRDETGNQESIANPYCHTVFKYLNMLLLGIVGFQFQAISQDPSKTLALYTWSFVIAIFIYSLILFAMKQSLNHCEMNLQIILGRVLLASGVVSSITLMSVLLPHFYGRMVLFVSWVLFLVISALPVLQRAYNGLLPGITTVIKVLICFARNLFTGSNLSQQQAPPQETRTPV